MNIEIRVQRGSRHGMVFNFPPGFLRIGRDPDSEIRLDPQQDLEVSARHAALYHERGHWCVRDENSTNGTFLNEQRLTGSARIHSGDRVTLGPTGPVLELRLMGASTHLAETAAVPAAHSGLRSRRTAILAALTIVVVATGAFLMARSEILLRRGRAEWEQERRLLLGRMDSVLRNSEQAVQSLEGERAELAAALRATQVEVRNARAALERAESESDTARVDELQQRLQAATVALHRQQLAASLDFEAIENANRSAVAKVFVEGMDDTVRTATAFAVDAEGTLLTVRHLLHGADGTRRPRRIAVQFSDSRKPIPARVLAVSDDADLALLRVDDVPGGSSIIAGLNARADTLGPGTPVAIIGYPLGGTSPAGSRPLVSAGVIATITDSHIEVQGYGAAGASGSPILDATGHIIAILYGGRSSAEGQLVLGVPVAAAMKLLEAVRRY
jgi:hypothetical protein